MPKKSKKTDDEITVCPLCDYIAPTEIHLMQHVSEEHPKEWARVKI